MLTAEDVQALKEEFERPPLARRHGWSFDYEHPGFFVYTHDTGKRVYFTPEWGDPNTVSIQIHESGSEEPTSWDRASFQDPLTPDRLFSIVRPYLTLRRHGRRGRKDWDPRSRRQDRS